MSKERRPSRIVMWLQYLGLRALAGFFYLLGPRLSMAVGSLLGKIMYRCVGRLRRRIESNIARSMPEWDVEQVRRVGLASVVHFVKLGIEVLTLHRIVKPSVWAKHIDVDQNDPGVAKALELIKADRPVILIGGHFGNWEVLGLMLSCWGHVMTGVARPIDNPLINHWLVSQREMYGSRVLTKFGATEEMVQVMGANGALAFVADQNAGKKGMFVPFFGCLASTYKSIGLLAIQYDAPVVCGYAIRTGHMKFQIGIEDVIMPEDWNAQKDSLYYVTARYAHAIESMVRRAPEQYLWNHRRWRSRPKHEYAGKPMPDGLRRQLLSLPWVQEADLEKLGTRLSDEERAG